MSSTSSTTTAASRNMVMNPGSPGETVTGLNSSTSEGGLASTSPSISNPPPAGGPLTVVPPAGGGFEMLGEVDRKSTQLNSSHVAHSYAVLCFKENRQTDGSR